MLTRVFIPLICGLLFGAGLALSGMTDTRVVLGFLDISGNWNPALLFVMAGALGITIPGFWFTQKRDAPLLSAQFILPATRAIEVKPLVGSVLFGIGWGLYGYCPGPALASLTTLDLQPLMFIAAMAAGMYAEKAWQQLQNRN